MLTFGSSWLLIAPLSPVGGQKRAYQHLKAHCALK
jgi:hypothetical protein